MTRRVVTIEQSGQGVIASDDNVLPTAIGAAQVFELWRSSPDGAEPTPNSDWVLEPPAGGHVFRVSVFPPAASGDAPWMHRTNTIDYALILEGELTLVTDDGDTLLRPGDVVVQQSANHGWINRTNSPVRMVVILIDRNGG